MALIRLVEGAFLCFGLYLVKEGALRGIWGVIDIVSTSQALSTGDITFLYEWIALSMIKYDQTMKFYINFCDILLVTI